MGKRTKIKKKGIRNNFTKETIRKPSSGLQHLSQDSFLFWRHMRELSGLFMANDLPIL